VVGDPAQHIGEPGLRIDTVQLGASDQGVGDRRRLAAALTRPLSQGQALGESQGSRIRNHGLCKMRVSKTVHHHWCSKVRLFSNGNMYVMRQLVYYSNLMREP
jgi:hypothetical protein